MLALTLLALTLLALTLLALTLTLSLTLNERYESDAKMMATRPESTFFRLARVSVRVRVRVRDGD